MTSVLVTGIGGSMGIDVARSLRQCDGLRLIGADSSVWGRRIGERICDRVVELPRAVDGAEKFLDILDATLTSMNVDFVFINPDTELEAIAMCQRVPCRLSPVPDPSVTGICLDKASTVAAAASDVFPQTFPISAESDVEVAFAQISGAAWLRARVGPGGRGSIVVETPEEARAWMSYWKKRGRVDRWVLQEYLPGRNINWTGLYLRGTLLASAAMERLRYFLGEATVSGVSGQVSDCKTIEPGECEAIADGVVRRLTPEPHGFFSVDMRCDRFGRPRVTEVNPRLAGRPWLYTSAGVNLPLAAVRAFTGRNPGDAIAPSGFTVGLHLHRQLDVEPIIGFPD